MWAVLTALCIGAAAGFVVGTVMVLDSVRRELTARGDDATWNRMFRGRVTS